MSGQKMSSDKFSDPKIYEMDRNRLLQYISDDQQNIMQALGKIRRGVETLEKTPFEFRTYIESAIATYLAAVYKFIERIFLRIAREVDMDLPHGSEYYKDPAPPERKWTYSLLSQMAEKRPERPPVVCPKTAQKLKRLLEFRNHVDESYTHELVYEETKKHVKQIDELLAIFFLDIDTFSDFLKGDKK